MSESDFNLIAMFLAVFFGFCIFCVGNCWGFRSGLEENRINGCQLVCEKKYKSNRLEVTDNFCICENDKVFKLNISEMWIEND